MPREAGWSQRHGNGVGRAEKKITLGRWPAGGHIQETPSGLACSAAAQPSFELCNLLGRSYLRVRVGSLGVPLQRALDVSKAVGDEAGAVLPVPAVEILLTLLHVGSCPVAFLREVPGHALEKQQRRLYPT